MAQYDGRIDILDGTERIASVLFRAGPHKRTRLRRGGFAVIGPQAEKVRELLRAQPALFVPEHKGFVAKPKPHSWYWLRAATYSLVRGHNAVGTTRKIVRRPPGEEKLPVISLPPHIVV